MRERSQEKEFEMTTPAKVGLAVIVAVIGFVIALKILGIIVGLLIPVAILAGLGLIVYGLLGGRSMLPGSRRYLP